MSFQVGDKIVYPNQGVGVVEQISNRNLTGQAETFYLLKLQSNGLRVMVPMTNVTSVGLRRVARSSEVGNVLAYLNNGSCKSPGGDWKGRFKENSEKMRTGSLLQVAEVFKTLLVISQAKPLSFREKRMLDRAWQLLLDEIAVVRGWAKEQAEQQLVKALSKSNLKVQLPS
ncbi:MAG TPA: CarD family transcriptional regulator [Terriglobia bacterium]|nr:CarD family transcriptional regulator [Terriglobia bacterium]